MRRIARVVSIFLLLAATACEAPPMFAAYPAHSTCAIGPGCGHDEAGVLLFDLTGGSPVELTATGGASLPVSWLPDGSGFVFEDRGKISLYDMASGTVRILVGPGGHGTPVVSPSGDRVLYKRWIAETQSAEIRVVGVDGHGDRLLFASDWSPSYSSQAWSPDGSQVVIWGIASGAPHWRLIDVASGASSQIDIPDDAWLFPSWSPNENVLAVASEAGGVLIVSPDGTVLDHLPGPVSAEPLWSPDGTRLASTGRNGLRTAAIYVWDTRTGAAPRQVVPDEGTNIVRDRLSSWSSDGTIIAFFRVLPVERDELMTVNVVTGDIRSHGKGMQPAMRPTDPSLPERRSDQILRLYRATFLRDPDPDGLAYWLSVYRAGQPLSAIATNFAGSSEFRARYGTLDDAAFVARIYQNVLEREPDAGGLAYWTQQLAGGMTRGKMLTGFSDSPEFVAKTDTMPPR